MGQYLRKLVLFAIVGVTVIDYGMTYLPVWKLVNLIFRMYDTHVNFVVVA